MKLNKSVKKQDEKRLHTQLEVVLKYMKKNRWKTLVEIQSGIWDYGIQKLGVGVYYPEASISARLRDIRAAGYRVEKKRVRNGGGQYTYRVFV